MPLCVDIFPSGDSLETSADYVRRWTLTNSCGGAVQIIDYGATITSFKVAARDGEIIDVVLGYDDVRYHDNSCQSCVFPRMKSSRKRVQKKIKLKSAPKKQM